MTRIDTDQDSVTLINVFTVDPDHQDQLLDRLIEATEETMQDVPGFISANFHKSLMANASSTMVSGRVGRRTKR